MKLATDHVTPDQVVESIIPQMSSSFKAEINNNDLPVDAQGRTTSATPSQIMHLLTLDHRLQDFAGVFHHVQHDQPLCDCFSRRPIDVWQRKVATDNHGLHNVSVRNFRRAETQASNLATILLLLSAGQTGV